jgi:hypothetical protein
MRKYTKEEFLKAAEIGEVSMIDAKHIVSLLDETESNPLTDSAVNPLLLAAGKLAMTARFVTTANAKNLSYRIEKMESALDTYDNEIFSLL